MSYALNWDNPIGVFISIFSNTMFIKIILVLTAICIATRSFSQPLPDHFLLYGKLTGQEDGVVYLNYPDNKNNQIKDSSLVKNGQFFFKGSISEPTKAYLTLKEEKRNELHAVGFYLEPVKMQLEVPAPDFSKAILSGSFTQNESIANQNSAKLISEKYKKQLDSLNTEKDPAKNAAIQERLVPYYAELDQFFFGYYIHHPESYLTPFSLRLLLRRLSLDSVRMFYNIMSPKVQSSRDGKILKREIELLAGGLPGSPSKNFTKTDINGNLLSLSDLKGKYVLLDFWASWCIPCRKGNPHLVKLYNQYKEKGLECIGVSDDDRNPDAWRKAVQKDSLLWRHVLRGLDIQKKRNGERNENDINENFGIYELPTKILIDPKGIIIGRFDENDSALDLLLKKVFGE